MPSLRQGTLPMNQMHLLCLSLSALLAVVGGINLEPACAGGGPSHNTTGQDT